MIDTEEHGTEGPAVLGAGDKASVGRINRCVETILICWSKLRAYDEARGGFFFFFYDERHTLSFSRVNQMAWYLSVSSV